MSIMILVVAQYIPVLYVTIQHDFLAVTPRFEATHRPLSLPSTWSQCFGPALNKAVLVEF